MSHHAPASPLPYGRGWGWVCRVGLQGEGLLLVMITTLSTDWGMAWGIAGISIGVVFAILILLVCVLYIFHFIAAGNEAKAAKAAKPKVLTGAEFVKSKQSSIATASELDKVAIATAVYLYMGGQHDDESGVLTIHHHNHTAWHAELNRHL